MQNKFWTPRLLYWSPKSNSLNLFSFINTYAAILQTCSGRERYGAGCKPAPADLTVVSFITLSGFPETTF
jgi:hypothetical protein